MGPEAALRDGGRQGHHHLHGLRGVPGVPGLPAWRRGRLHPGRNDEPGVAAGGKVDDDRVDGRQVQVSGARRQPDHGGGGQDRGDSRLPEGEGGHIPARRSGGRQVDGHLRLRLPRDPARHGVRLPRPGAEVDEVASWRARRATPGPPGP